jgi:serine/threonine protein kinase
VTKPTQPLSDPVLSATHMTIPTLVASSRDDRATGTDFGAGSERTVETIGGYHVVRLIGRGGMGVVYEAVEPALERRVALKILRPELAATPHARDLFLREARAAAAVRNDHVVTIHAIGEAAGLPFLTMELLTGTTLECHLQSGPRPLAEVLRIGQQVALGLAAVHALGLIHGDVKPENIWIEAGTGRAKLLDFGLVLTARSASTLGHVYGFAGTLLYASPEQAHGDPLDARSDLFSLGSVLYRAVAGRAPFARTSVPETLAALTSCHPPPIDRHAPHLPGPVADLIHRLLAPRPQDRPPSAEAVAEECRSVSGALSSVEVVRRPADEPPSDGATVPLRRRARWLRRGSFVVVVCTLLAGALGLVGLIRNPPPTPPRDAPDTSTPTAAEGEDLLDPNTLAGWSPPHGGRSDRWTVAGGVLTSRSGVGDQILYTDREFRDFDLGFEYRWLAPGGHTTLLLRAERTSDGEDALRLNLGDDEGFPAVHGRDIGVRYRTGGLQAVFHDVAPANAPIGAWNRMRVRLLHQRITVEQNGAPIASVNLDQHLDQRARVPAITRTRGPIGLVSHWGAIEYRNIRIKLLP